MQENEPNEISERTGRIYESEPGYDPLTPEQRKKLDFALEKHKELMILLSH